MSFDDARSWNDGYVTEIAYTRNFYRELDPLRYGFAALAAGIRPPPLDRPFTHFELGCGHGLTSNVMAAANPDGTFFANDFNPSHVLSARALAGKAGLDNITFFEHGFDALDELDLPELDYIALHGIYSWVSADNRERIVAFIRRRLKPGGMVYISYNSLPGSAQTAALRRLFVEHAERHAGPLDRRMGEALRFARQMREAGADFFSANGRAARRLDTAAGERPDYLVHEFLGEHWTPFHHGDVAGDLARAKLDYVCSATIIENIERFVLRPEMHELYRRATDAGLRELIKDFATNQSFRRDVFAKGTLRLTSAERRALLERQRIALVRPRAQCATDFKTPAGAARLQPATYGRILDDLAAGPKTIAELSAAAEGTANPIEAMADAVAVLIGAGYASPALPADGQDRRRVRTEAFNRAALDEAAQGGEIRAMASPVLNTGVGIGRIDQIFLLGVVSGSDDLAAFAWRHLNAGGVRIKKDGRALQDAAESLAELHRLALAFTDGRLPMLRRLGIAPEAREREAEAKAPDAPPPLPRIATG